MTNIDYKNYDLFNVKPGTSLKDWLQMVILLVMGGYFTWLISSGKLSNYINLRFQWLTIVAAGVFLVAGIWRLFNLLRGRSNTRTVFEHTPISWQSMGIVMIPLLLAAFVPSHPLGADAISGGVSLNAIGGNTVVNYKKDPLQRDILDWLREFDTVKNPAAFNGEQLRLIGFVYREPGMGDNQFMIARFTMSCCVADAFAIGIPVEVANAEDYADDTWLEIEGTFKTGTFMERETPIILPNTVTPIDMPTNPYLYS